MFELHHSGKQHADRRRELTVHLCDVTENAFNEGQYIMLFVSYLLAEVKRNHAVVLGVEDQHRTGDVTDAVDTNTTSTLTFKTCSGPSDV